MENNRDLEEQRMQLDDIVSQVGRRLMLQLDPYIASRRGLDLDEKFYDLKRELPIIAFSDRVLSNRDNKQLDPEVENKIKEYYEDILKRAILSTVPDNFQDVKHVVTGSYRNLLEQVEKIEQMAKDTLTKNELASIEMDPLLADAKKAIEYAEAAIAEHQGKLATLSAQLSMLEREKAEREKLEKEEAERKETEREESGKEEEAKSEEQKVPSLEDVDNLIAGTNRMIEEHQNKLKEIEAQLKAQAVSQDSPQAVKEELSTEISLEGLEGEALLKAVDKILASTGAMVAMHKAQIDEMQKQLRGQEDKATKPAMVAQDPFKLSDEDMAKFNAGVESLKREDAGSRGKDKTDKIDDLTK